MDDRLQKFARLTEIGSFTKAAKVLHISQPALSIAIDKLEQELGAELLVRGNRRLDLTEAGKVAYAAALEHQNTAEQLLLQLNRITNKRPVVHIGMVDSIAAILCATPAFEALEATADVTVVVNNSRYLREALEHRRLDVAFVIDDAAEHPLLQTAKFGSEELVIVCHPALLTTATAELSARKLTRFISYDKPSTTYRHIQQSLQTQGIKTQTLLFSTSPTVMLDLVLRGKGTAALPRLLVAPHIKAKQLCIAPYQGVPLVIERPVSITRLRGKALPPVLESFLQTSSITPET